jgi:dipeptidyl aminopeptidase/acylaminoacyl peptidase
MFEGLAPGGVVGAFGGQMGSQLFPQPWSITFMTTRLVRTLVVCLANLSLCVLAAQPRSALAAPKRALEVGDFSRILDVDGAVCSRDGQWILYTVEGTDRAADERKRALWMVNWQGSEHVRLTMPDSVSKPTFSPDGRRIAFLSERGADGKTQIYLLDRRGGEAQALTSVTGAIDDYDWSPDGTRLVVSMAPDAAEAGGKTPKPIVIDRLHFKQDEKGYVTSADRNQLYLLDVASQKLEALTADPRFDDSSPVWSPDGRTIAYFSDHGSDPDESGMQELYVVDARPGAVPRKLAAFFAPNKAALLFTRDGSRIIFAHGAEPRLNAYMQDHLTVVTVATGKSKELSDTLDRALSSPVLTASDGAIAAIIEDDGSDVPVVLRLDTGAIKERLAGKLTTTSLCSGGGHMAVVVATDNTAPELYALEAGRLRKLTTHNDELMDELILGAVDDIAFPSRDGTLIHGMMVKPADFHAGQKYPTLLWIHGGPNGQDSHGLNFSTYPLAFERQWFAAHGYVVLAINYRGGSGRGAEFANTIQADWGDKEVADLLAAVDYAVRENIADPERLGIGGWSYGGILTDYTIATDPRFKAAISGAGSANQLSMFGSDQYILQYNAELGAPWRATDLWLKVSYPFFHADRIKTPTLFLGGDKDFNVPVGGGEQMYAALRTLGVPTQLVVYPGQYHLFTRPSYIEDRATRYLDWFDRYLAPAK